LQNVSSNLTPLNFSTGEKSITLSTPLPALTFDLKQRIEKFGVLAAHKRLMHHYRSYLWEITAGRPSKRDYQNLADNIVREFPLLVSNAGDSAIVRTTLSSWIRNHRTNIKKEASKRDVNGVIIKQMKSAIHIAINEESESADDVQQLLDELIKNKKDSDTPHIRRLLKLTMQKRRKWLENEATSIDEILSTYTQLKNIELLLFEFYNLKNLTKEDTNSLKDLIPAQGESPRSVIFQNSSGEIVGALLIADQNSMKIENPSMEKIVASLLAAYYVFHTHFPKPYRNILEYFDHKIIGADVKKNQVLQKFLRATKN
ncbi:hypothetical protein PV325_013445, partial [Microctonus aethiopoides]